MESPYINRDQAWVSLKMSRDKYNANFKTLILKTGSRTYFFFLNTRCFNGNLNNIKHIVMILLVIQIRISSKCICCIPVLLPLHPWHIQYVAFCLIWIDKVEPHFRTANSHFTKVHAFPVSPDHQRLWIIYILPTDYWFIDAKSDCLEYRTLAPER